MFTNGEYAAICRALNSSRVAKTGQFWIVANEWFQPTYMLASEIDSEPLLIVGSLLENGKWRIRRVQDR